MRPPTSERLWQIEVFIGMFHPTRVLVVQSRTQFEAECLADELLAPGEWFSSFTASPVKNLERQANVVPQLVR